MMVKPGEPTHASLLNTSATVIEIRQSMPLSSQVVGTDPSTIVVAAWRTLETDSEYPTPGLWDGRASERIVDALLDEPPERRLRPTDLS